MIQELLCRIGLHKWRAKKTRPHKHKVVTIYVCWDCPAKKRDVIRR